MKPSTALRISLMNAVVAPVWPSCVPGDTGGALAMSGKEGVGMLEGEKLGRKISVVGAQEGKVNETGFEAFQHFVSQLNSLSGVSIN